MLMRQERVITVALSGVESPHLQNKVLLFTGVARLVTTNCNSSSETTGRHHQTAHSKTVNHHRTAHGTKTPKSLFVGRIVVV